MSAELFENGREKLQFLFQQIEKEFESLYLENLGRKYDDGGIASADTICPDVWIS